MAAECLGHSNISIVQDEDVNEGRYDFMRRAQVVIVPETMGGDRRDLANKLKPLITQRLVRISAPKKPLLRSAFLVAMSSAVWRLGVRNERPSHHHAGASPPHPR